MAKALRQALLPGLVLVILALLALGSNPPAPRSQPIAFPHEQHISLNRMDCTFCHPSPTRTGKAGMPPLGVCADCHIPQGVPTVRADRPEVKKLVRYWRERRPVPWANIYDVPAHARFPHGTHVITGMLCDDCHGPVLPGRDLGLDQPLTMTWCVSCHERQGARADCVACHY